jgi:hypothetical protein
VKLVQTVPPIADTKLGRCGHPSEIEQLSRVPVSSTSKS